MKNLTAHRFFLTILLPVTVLLYALYSRMLLIFGKPITMAGVALVLLAVLSVYVLVRSKESDEREQELSFRSDSIALVTVILGLLFCTLFYPASHAGMLLWIVLLLAGIGHAASALFIRK